MRHMIPDYFGTFQCVGDKCLNTCCKDWTIAVDEQAYDTYCGLEGEFAKKIRDSISEDKNFILQDGKCPLLEEDGLCSIHKTYGEDYLTIVCRTYPRCSHRYYDLYEEFVGLSCPEVVRILIKHKDKIYFCQDEIENANKESNFLEEDRRFFERMEEMRSICIDLVQLDEFPIWKRLFFLIDVCKQMDTCSSLNEDMQYKALISKYSDRQFLDLYAKQMDDTISVNQEAKYNFYKNIVLILMEQAHIYRVDFRNQIKQAYDLMFHEKEKFNKSVIQDMDENIQFNEFWKDLSCFRENLCVYSIFNNFFSYINTKDIWKETAYIIVGFSFIKILLYVNWKLNGYSLSEDQLCFIISVYARGFEHSANLRDEFYRALKESGVICQAYLVILLNGL